MQWVRLALDFVARLFMWWKSREDAAAKANVEMAAEVAEHDRKKANAIRDRVDGARLGGGLGPKEGDNRGYRVD